MRRTKHRRRFHTDRIIRNRQARRRREVIIFWNEDSPGYLENGWLDKRYNYSGCTRPRCLVCKYGKLLFKDERLEGTRQCRQWWREY